MKSENTVPSHGRPGVSVFRQAGTDLRAVRENGARISDHDMIHRLIMVQSVRFPFAGPLRNPTAGPVFRLPLRGRCFGKKSKSESTAPRHRSFLSHRSTEAPKRRSAEAPKHRKNPHPHAGSQQAMRRNHQSAHAPSHHEPTTHHETPRIRPQTPCQPHRRR
jgi:hypothetical protein